MTRTVEAVIEPNGTVRLLQPIHVTKPTRATLTVTEEPVEAPSRPAPRTLEEALQLIKDAKTPEELFAAGAAAAPFQTEPEGYDLEKALEENRKVPFCRPVNLKEWGYDDE